AARPTSAAKWIVKRWSEPDETRRTRRLGSGAAPTRNRKSSGMPSCTERRYMTFGWRTRLRQFTNASVLVLVVACGAVSSVENQSHVGDAAVGTDADGSRPVCDMVTQSGCASGEKCA